MSATTGSWDLRRVRGGAADLHARTMPDPPRRLVEVLEVERRAVVLGSTQSISVLDAEAVASAGVEVARRRSGGGAVLLVPGQALWVDVVLPPSDVLWCDDVGRAFHWLGEAWAGAFADVGVGDLAVHRGGLCTTSWSRLVCFGGLGSGEVTESGRKVVGISQRRGRLGARFQCVVHLRWQPSALLALLALDADESAAAVSALEQAATGVDADPTRLLEALLGRLPN